MTRTLLPALVLALLGAGCSNPKLTSPSDTTAVTSYTEFFTGNLSAGESSFYSFTVAVAGTTNITLVSLRPIGVTTSAVATPVGLGLGTPAGTGCSQSTLVTAQPGLAAQMSAPTSATIYCVDIHDIGSVRDPLTFTVRIVHP